MVVAAAAGRCDVVPYVDAALRQGRNVVPGQIASPELLRAVEAQVGVALEQRPVIERWHVLVPNEDEALPRALGRNNRVDFDLAAASVESVVTTEHRVERRTARVGDLLVMVEPDRFPVVDPFEWHSSHVGSKDLLRDI